MTSSSDLKIILDKIQSSNLDQLRSNDYLENVILFGGLHKDLRGIYGSLQPFMRNTKGGFYQIPSQLASALIELSKESIQTICDIGTLNGWSTLFIYSYLSKFNPNISCISLDPKERNLDPIVPQLIQSFQFDIKLIRGTSKDYAKSSYSLCIIDGCHDDNWIRTDYNLIGQHSKICWFHDINDRYCHDVVHYYKELCIKNSNHKEFLSHPDSLNIMGIGLMWNQPKFS